MKIIEAQQTLASSQYVCQNLLVTYSQEENTLASMARQDSNVMNKDKITIPISYIVNNTVSVHVYLMETLIIV